MSHQEDSLSQQTNVKEHDLASWAVSTDVTISDLKSFFQDHGCVQLLQLLEAETSTILVAPITLSELEMLEAELFNQGIVTAHGDALHKLVRKDISTLKWNLRKHSPEIQKVEFQVDLTQYILMKAFEVRSQVHVDSPLPIENSSLKNLQYLNQMAAYLNGRYSHPSSAYERAQNLVLNTIISGAKSRKSEDSDIHKKVVILPKSKKNILSELES